MESNNSRSDDLGSKRLNLINVANKMIRARNEQTIVYNRRPVAYVMNLLQQLSEAERVPQDTLAGELQAFLPELSKGESDRLVSLYLRGVDEALYPPGN